MNHALLEAKRKPDQTPMIAFFNCVIEADKVTTQGFAMINPVRPDSKMNLFVNGEVVATVTIPYLPSLFSLEELILTRLESDVE